MNTWTCAPKEAHSSRRARRSPITALCGDVTLWLACGAAVCGLVLTLYTLRHAAAVSFDAARYLELAAAYATGGIRAALDWYAGPAVPVIVGTLYRWTGQLELAGRVAGIVAAGLLLAGLWLLLRRVSDRQTANLGIALAATHPALIRHAPSAEIDLPYLAALTLALYLVIAACQRRRGQLIAALLAGLAFGAAYLIRPEGLLVAAVVCSYLLVSGRAAVALRRSAAAMVLAVATLVAGPYLVWLHDSLGRWTLSGKDRTLSLKYLPDKRHPERALRAGPLGAIRQNPDDLIQWLPVHAKRTVTELPKAAGYVPLLLATLGVVSLLRRRFRLRRPAVAILLAACLPPTIAFALLYPYERYFLQVVPLVAVLAAVGMSRLWQWRRAWWLAPVAIAANLAIASVQAHEPLEASRAYRRAIGEQIAAEFGPGRRVLAFTVEAFYARAQRVKRWDPFEGIVPGHGFGKPFSYERMLAFLKAHQVEVVVVDHHFLKDCPEFLSKLRPEDFRLAFVAEHNGERIRVYEVLAVTAPRH